MINMLLQHRHETALEYCKRRNRAAASAAEWVGLREHFRVSSARRFLARAQLHARHGPLAYGLHPWLNGVILHLRQPWLWLQYLAQ